MQRHIVQAEHHSHSWTLMYPCWQQPFNTTVISHPVIYPSFRWLGFEIKVLPRLFKTCQLEKGENMLSRFADSAFDNGKWGTSSIAWGGITEKGSSAILEPHTKHELTPEKDNAPNVRDVLGQQRAFEAGKGYQSRVLNQSTRLTKN